MRQHDRVKARSFFVGAVDCAAMDEEACEFYEEDTDEESIGDYADGILILHKNLNEHRKIKKNKVV